MGEDAGSERLRRHSLWLARLTMVLLAGCLLVLVLPPVRGLASLPPGQPAGPRVAQALAFASPSLFYLFALWAIGRAFRGFARGGTLGPAMALGCRRAGIALALGGAMSAVGLPNLFRLLSQQGLIPAPRHGYGSVLVFDTAYLALGIVGIALFLLGGLVERAGQAQEEARALRAELGEFF